MKLINNFDEAKTILARFAPRNGAAEAYTLDRMQTLMDFLDNPQEKLTIVHVAGTSGKTSTCYYAAALLRAAGHKVGLTVSPHVVEVNERLQINLAPLPESEFCRALSEFLELISKSGVKPTYFELLVAFAYWEFAKQQVDYVVMEVGLGGLLDATNVISNQDKVCIITDIGFDHVNVLGHSLTEIATQKAGIIQSRNTVFCYKQAQEINNVITARCQEQQAILRIINSDTFSDKITFLPLFQQRNYTLAQTTINFVLQRDDRSPLTKEQFLQAAHVDIPARMEIFKYKAKTVILDGAHNAQKLHALILSIKSRFKSKSVAALIGFAAHKEPNLASSIHEIIELTDHLIITSFKTGQDFMHTSVDPKTIVNLCKQEAFYNTEVELNTAKALDKLLARKESVLLVTGSFYLLSHVRPLLLELTND